MYDWIISDGPIQIEISPQDNTYTVTETGSINQITCTADCSPSCTTTWTGPNLPAGSTSILHLQNIDRNQAGAYNCTAVNEISSLTLKKVNVIVNCKYDYLIFSYKCYMMILIQYKNYGELFRILVYM